MKNTKFSNFWDSLNSSFWFVPTVMVFFAIGLSFVTIGIDQNQKTNLIGELGWAYTLGLSGARFFLRSPVQ